MSNPFSTVGYLGPDTFCDRETKEIVGSASNHTFGTR